MTKPTTLFFATLLVAFPAYGQRSAEQAKLVELLAKVSFNEALDSYHDLALIVQVSETHGAHPAARVRWLEQHSPCVSGRLSAEQALSRGGNCRWTRNLTPSARMPAGFLPGMPYWRRISARWLAHLERVRAFVDGRDDYRPCPEAPRTWDGVRYGRERVLRRGRTRRILECAVPYVTEPGAEGLHNYAITWGPGPEVLPAEPVPN